MDMKLGITGCDVLKFSIEESKVDVPYSSYSKSRWLLGVLDETANAQLCLSRKQVGIDCIIFLRGIFTYIY